MSPEEDVERMILDLKRSHEVQSDDDLASALGVSRSTISSWRSRGSVPPRYLVSRFGGDKSSWSHAPREWSDEEKAAFNLTLIRLARSGDFEFDNYADYLRRSDATIAKIWIGMAAAKREIIAKVDASEEMSVRNAMHLIAYCDFHSAAEKEG